MLAGFVKLLAEKRCRAFSQLLPIPKIFVDEQRGQLGCYALRENRIGCGIVDPESGKFFPVFRLYQLDFDVFTHPIDVFVEAKPLRFLRIEVVLLDDVLQTRATHNLLSEGL